MMPKVSIIIPTYNCGNFLKETLESVLAQTYSNKEILIIDDGSTDNTKEILKPFENEIRYFYQKNSGGPARPRNIGIQNANGKYIAIFDSDDIMLPEKISQSVNFLESEPILGMAFTNFIKINEKGEIYPGRHLDIYENFWNVKKIKVGKNQYIIKNFNAFEALFFENYIGTSGVIALKDVFSKVGLFDEAVTHGGLEDRDMWLRIARSFDIGYLDIIGHKYRVRKGSVSKRTLTSNLNRIRVLKRHIKFINSKRIQKQARILIAECLYGVGYEYQDMRDLKNARKYYFGSLKTCWSKKGCKGYSHFIAWRENL